MNKNIIAALLIICQAGFAQSLNIKLDPAPEYLSYSPLYTYVPQGEKYLKNYIQVLYDETQQSYYTELVSPEIVDVKASIAQNPNIFDLIVRYDDIRNATFEDLNKELNEIEFTYSPNKQAVNFSNGYAIYNCCTVYNDKAYYNGDYYKIVPVTLNKKKTILYLMEGTQVVGYVLPLKNTFYLKLYRINSKAVAGPLKNKEELDKSVNYSFPKGEIFKKENKYGVKADNFLKTILIKPVYDTIYPLNGNLISAVSNRKASVFFLNGTPVEIPGLRGIYTNNSGNTSALVDDKILWLNRDGTLTDKLEPMMGGCGTVPLVTDSIIIKNGYYINRYTYDYGGRDVKDYKLVEASAYKSLQYLDQTVVHQQRLMGSPAYKLPLHWFIATTTDNQKRIVEIKYRDSNTPVVKELFALTNNKIIKSNLYEPLRYESNGLVGVWPQNNTAHYKVLNDFEKGFARFTLPDGRQGWLSLDGQEYIDQ